jgi:hypothetical protein
VVLPNVTTAEAVSGVTHYACICIRNTGAATIINAGVYFSSDVQNARIYIALGLTGKNSYSEQYIGSNIVAPTGNLVFQKPAFDYAPLSVGTLYPGDWYNLWLKRIVSVYASGEASAYFILTGTES